MTYTKDEVIEFIDIISGSQSAETIAESQEDDGKEYDKEKAEELLTHVKRVLLGHIIELMN
jgi:hypothetical protein